MGIWSFAYDTLNRLATATAASAAADAAAGVAAPYASNYGCWSYDSFGNRLSESISTTPCTSTPLPLTSWANYNANNQFTATSQALGGVPYDASGDVLNDGKNQYLYDGEGRICAVASTPIPGMTVMTGYLYDADGTRVAKGSITAWSCDPAVSGFHTTNDYILGLGGEQVTEMGVDTTGATNTLAWQHTNVWAGGKLLATYDNNGLHFYFDDPLGTRRVQTDYAGVVEKDCASLPYGDGETCAPTPTEHLFTGKERDTESGNDYFGARYYASSMGRWMSPDLPFADQDTENPQSWNLYSYVRNNPLNHIDDSGMLTIIIGGTGYNPHDWNYSHSPLTSEAQSHFNDPAVGFLYWSGGLSDRDRIAGAEQLRKMINNYSFAPGEQLNIIAHSHGGNVALEAAQMQLNHPIDNLITLGTPGVGMYVPDTDTPGNWRNIGAWYNIQGSTDWVPSLDSDTNSTNRPGARNFTVPTTGLGHYGEAHTALWRNNDIRSQWWNWWLNQQSQQSPPCARTGASDNHGNSTGMSGCQ
jgi:RHS repeat-associated protein